MNNLNTRKINAGPYLMRVFCLGIMSVLCLTCLAYGDDTARKNKQGNVLYGEGKYEEALQSYRDAQLESPESPEIHNNIGTVLYQQKKYEEGQQEYTKALSTEDALLQSQVYYNIGNCQYRANKLVESIDSYKKCLEMNPNDMDAKYNLEFVRNKLKEMAEQQQQQGQQQQQAQGQEQQQQGGQQQEKQQEQQQQAGQQQQDQQQGQEQEDQKQQEAQKQDQQGQQQQPTEKKEGEMTEAEAQRILDALKDDEKDVQKEMRRMQLPGKRRVEKDW